MTEIILALDVATADAGRQMLDRVPDLRWVKLGPVLMTRVGAPFVQEVAARGLRVFLDLKWHDIPNSVAGAVGAARDLGVAMATVHTLGGTGMLEAAVKAAGGGVALVGVTVLTSHDKTSYAAATGRAVGEIEVEARRMAAIANSAGLDGVVCSPQEISAVRQVWKEAVVVVPGIRQGSEPKDDQTRVSTAGDAARDGATHLVVGRPLLHATDPAKVLEELREEVACALA
ncbi:MAG TPA: orotidine-5'-phosphate decarboxylase [Gemmatimonadales bacterium]|jgi:orotidine-5'-phosphate decarboxylase|nr:orotidine-5'-phosphate decarboxylase [Gemmatimonadales bacterium]